MQMLGHYEIRSKLSHGRFATVYHAFDTQSEREVALKVLPPQLSLDLVFVERFHAEMGRLAALRHPHLVTVYAAGEVDRHLVIATELVKGPSLARVIAQRGFIPWAEGLALLQAVCQALDYMHEQGVAHQDLKPANILLERGALLTDFGWMHLAWQSSSVSMSMGGGITSTPGYAAPEVWGSNVAQPPADIYALGCVLYEMLSGRALFAGKTPLQVELAHERGLPFPDRWRGDAPDEVGAVLRKALARRPDERYPNAGAFWQALNGLPLRSGPAKAGPAQTQALVQTAVEERARREAERASRQAEERAKREADRAGREAEARARREADRAKREVEGCAELGAEERAKREAGRAGREAEARARREADRAERETERARLEAEAREKREAEEYARLEAEEREKREAEEYARLEAEEREKQEIAERARREAEERARREAEAVKRKTEERARRAVEAREKREAAAREKQEAEARAKHIAEKRAKRQAEERAQRAVGARERQESEARERRKAEAHEKEAAARKPIAEIRTQRQAEARAEREAAERAQPQAEERKKQDAEADEYFAKEREEREKKEAAAREYYARERARRASEELARREIQARRKRRSSAWLWIILLFIGGGCILCPFMLMINSSSSTRTPVPTRTRAFVIRTPVPTRTRAFVIRTATAKPFASPRATPTPLPPARPAGNTLRANLDGGLFVLDPHVARGSNSSTIAAETFVGLTRLDEETSQVQPGMAKQWTVSEDGKKYTFDLRQNVPWVRWDGEQVSKVKDCDGQDRLVTAHDFEYGLKRALDPAFGMSDVILTRFIAGGEAFNSGLNSDPDTVGVRAIDDWTIEISFTQEAAYNPSLLGLWLAVAVPQWVIEGDACTEARGDEWAEPDSFQSYGPFALKEWDPDSHLTLVKNPFWPTSAAVPHPRLREITFTMLSSTDAWESFQAGELDVSSVPAVALSDLKADPALSPLVKAVPSMCSYYYGFNTAAEHVSDARVRRALSLALDREELVDVLMAGEMAPARWFAYPGLLAAPTLERYPDLGAWYDPDEAKRLLDDYLAEKGLTAEDVDVTLSFSSVSGHGGKIFTGIQKMWKDNLGLEVKAAEVEANDFLATIRGQDAPQMWRSGWCMDYPDAGNFTGEVFTFGSLDNAAQAGRPAGGAHWKNERFEELVSQAAKERDPDKRTELYAQAEQILCYEDAVIVPLYWHTRLVVTQPWVERTFALGGGERYEKWWLR